MPDNMGMPPTIPQAQGNPSMASLLQMIQSREAERPNLQQQQQALQQYLEAVKNSQPMDTDAWNSAGRGILSSPATSMWEGAGDEIVKRNELARQDQRARDVAAGKLNYDDVIKRRDETDKSITPLLRGMLTGGGSHAIIGNMPNGDPIYKQGDRYVALSKDGGFYEVSAGGKTIAGADTVMRSAEDATKRWAEGVDWTGKTADQKDAEISAYRANKYKELSTLGTSTKGMLPPGTARVVGAPPLPGINPGTAPIATPPGELPPLKPGQSAQATGMSYPQVTPDEQAAYLADRLETIRREMVKYKDNPMVFKDLQRQEKETVYALNTLPDAGRNSAVATTPVAETSNPQKPLMVLDPVKRAMEKGGAEDAGKALIKESVDLNKGAAQAGTMVNQLDLLEKLYSTPGMPEGEYGPLLQQVRSGLVSIGVLDPKQAPSIAAADMARAVASNFALHLRGDLLPGQMSNYEDRLLQQMAPVLSLTQEGRLALIQFMRETSKSNMRLAHEINQMTDSRGVVSPEWRMRKERIMREEMARIAMSNREIMKRFQGAQQ